MSVARIFPVIMAGGASSRLWPASGLSKPKWDLRLFGSGADKSQSLLENVWARGRSVAPAAQCFVVTGVAQAELVRKSLPELPPENLLVEPEPRDTSGAVAYATGAILNFLNKHNAGREDDENIMLVLPGDQIISPLSEFAACALTGAKVAIEHDALVTFGILPRKPATGYGYIHRAGALEVGSTEDIGRGTKLPLAYRVQGFKEKPDLATAEAYIKSGEYYWNGGIFLWRVSAVQAEFQRQLPGHAALATALGRTTNKEEWDALARESFPNLKKISIDYGIMENARTVATVVAEFEWDDIGSWSAVADHLDKSSGNAIGPQTNVLSLDSKSNLVFTPGKRVALIGVEGLAIVESENEILICKLDRDQDVKKISEMAKKSKLE